LTVATAPPRPSPRGKRVGVLVGVDLVASVVVLLAVVVVVAMDITRVCNRVRRCTQQDGRTAITVLTVLSVMVTVLRFPLPLLLPRLI
jgi:hypothetical protein